MGEFASIHRSHAVALALDTLAIPVKLHIVDNAFTMGRVWLLKHVTVKELGFMANTVRLSSLSPLEQLEQPVHHHPQPPLAPPEQQGQPQLE